MMSIVAIIVVVMMIGSLYSLVLGVSQIIASRRLRALQGHGGVNTIAVMSLIPLYPMVILGLPIAIWVLSFINRSRTREAFEFVEKQQQAIPMSTGKIPPIQN